MQPVKLRVMAHYKILLHIFVHIYTTGLADLLQTVSLKPLVVVQIAPIATAYDVNDNEINVI